MGPTDYFSYFYLMMEAEPACKVLRFLNQKDDEKYPAYISLITHFHSRRLYFLCMKLIKALKYEIPVIL
jgi:hypothetical protein